LKNAFKQVNFRIRKEKSIKRKEKEESFFSFKERFHQQENWRKRIKKPQQSSAE
jgi:hypothetical protein